MVHQKPGEDYDRIRRWRKWKSNNQIAAAIAAEKSDKTGGG
jgi:hypothetical protein